MKNLLSLCVMISVLILAGHGIAFGRTDPCEDGVVTIERHPAQGTYFHSLHVSQEDSEILISGELKRHRTSASPGIGHLDIAIISPDGKIIDYKSTVYVPSVLSRRSHRGSSFKVSFPVVPPKDSVIRVAWHKDSLMKENK